MQEPQTPDAQTEVAMEVISGPSDEKRFALFLTLVCAVVLVFLPFLALGPVWVEITGFTSRDTEHVLHVTNHLEQIGYKKGESFRVEIRNGEPRTIIVPARAAKKIGQSLSLLAQNCCPINSDFVFGKRTFAGVVRTEIERVADRVPNTRAKMKKLIVTETKVDDVKFNVISSRGNQAKSKKLEVILSLKPGSSIQKEQVDYIVEVVRDQFPELARQNVIVRDQNRYRLSSSEEKTKLSKNLSRIMNKL